MTTLDFMLKTGVIEVAGAYSPHEALDYRKCQRCNKLTWHIKKLAKVATYDAGSLTKSVWQCPCGKIN
jgi:hypothetical protein